MYENKICLSSKSKRICVNRYKKRSRRGLATVEMALVLPLLIILTVGLIESSIQFWVRGEMIGAAREAARELAVRESTVQEASDVALSRLAHINANFEVTASVDTTIDGNNDATVRITVPVSDILAGIITSTEGRSFITQVTMRREDLE